MYETLFVSQQLKQRILYETLVYISQKFVVARICT